MKVFFATTPLFLLAVTGVTIVSSSNDSDNDEQQQCNGVPPQVDMVQYLGATLDYEMADRICCHNHHYAEPKGYLNEPQVAIFDKLNPDEETIFYDVVCGLPLFIAPRGRSFADFQAESLHHGWPSFRPEEMISENVILHDDGRMESVCLTHLGHNLPESGVDRYCIDLVCIAGSPLTVSEGNLTKQFPSLLMVDVKEENKEVSTESSESDSANTSDTATTTTTTTDSFGSGSVSGIVTSDSLLEDPNAYVSSAEQNSGKVSHKKRNIIIGVVIGVLCLGIIISFVLWYTKSSGARKNNKNNKDKDNNSTHKDVENNNNSNDNDNDNDTSNEVEE